MALYEGTLAFLKTIGFFDIILPWILIYAITYGILIRSKLFGEATTTEEKKAKEAEFAKSISSLIAFSIATIAIASVNLIRTINEFIPLVVLFIIVLFSFALILSGFVMPTTDRAVDEFRKKYSKLITILALITFFILVLNFFGLLKVLISFFTETGASVASGGSNIPWAELINSIIILGIIFGVMAWLYREGGSKKSNTGNAGGS